jgi:hypothetical protein
MVQIAIVVRILHILSLDISILKLVGGAEGLFDDRARDHVLQLCTNESRTLTGLYVLELNDLQNVALSVVKSNAVFEIASYYHNLPPK